MSIREELGITADQFRRLKEEIVKEIVSPKKKQYRMMACPNCKGSGQVVEQTINWCLYERLQDEDLGCIEVFNSRSEVDEYLKEREEHGVLFSSSMFTIVAPDGEIVS